MRVQTCAEVSGNVPSLECVKGWARDVGGLPGSIMLVNATTYDQVCEEYRAVKYYREVVCLMI